MTLLIFGTALWFVLVQGKGLESGRVCTPSVSLESTSAFSEPLHFLSNVERNSRHPLAILIIQILSIMVIARAFGYLMIKIGQPAVVGEIIAGIALGPSLVGAIFPEFSAFLFPEESLRRLHVLSQIGLVLFMFIIGMELDIGVLRKKAHTAVIVSHASIIIPYFLGVALAYQIYATYAPENVSFVAFALFMGIAMSITAFPVLARILQERNLTYKPIGTLVITCAAADDITAWCLLALVVAIVNASGMISAVSSIILSLFYVLFMWFGVRPVLHRVAFKYDTPESISKTVVAVIFGILFLSSYLTEIIGIHALFGAFFAGVVMPAQKEFKRILSEKIEDVSLVLLLPLFFVFTGLRTQVGLLNNPELWGVCFLIIGVAVTGKFLGSALAAKFVGQSWKDSFFIGALMNTRGLMELIVLNIGYDLGILSAEIFTMMVIMALVTTLMTGPAIHFIEVIFDSRKKFAEQAKIKEGFNVLLAFGAPRSGSRLLELAYYLNLKNEKEPGITAAHFSPSADISLLEAEQYEREAFEQIDATGSRLGIPVNKIFKVTDDVEREIVRNVRKGSFDIVLLGSSRELFTNDKTGGKVKNLIQQIACATGVFIDKGFSRIENVLVVLDGMDDAFLLKYAQRLLESREKRILSVLDRENILSADNAAQGSGGVEFRGDFSLVGPRKAEEKDFYKAFSLVIVSLAFWEHFKGRKNDWLSRVPSVLIINR